MLFRRFGSRRRRLIMEEEDLAPTCRSKHCSACETACGGFTSVMLDLILNMLLHFGTLIHRQMSHKLRNLFRNLPARSIEQAHIITNNRRDMLFQQECITGITYDTSARLQPSGLVPINQQHPSQRCPLGVVTWWA